MILSKIFTTAKKHDKIPRKFSRDFISPLSIINKTHVELSYFDTKALMTYFTGHWKQRLVLDKTFSRNILPRDQICVQVCKNGQTLTIIQRIASKFYFKEENVYFGVYVSSITNGCLERPMKCSVNASVSKQDSSACTLLIDKEDMNFVKNFSGF